MTRFFLGMAILLVFAAIAEGANTDTHANLQGTWVTDVDASRAYMTEQGKAELIESLPFLASTYKYVLNENTMTTFRKDVEVGRATITQVLESEGKTTLSVAGTNPKTKETVEFQIIFVPQPNDHYIIKLSNSPANDYFVWTKNKKTEENSSR